jgi:hypothetical protein
MVDRDSTSASTQVNRQPCYKWAEGNSSYHASHPFTEIREGLSLPVIEVPVG